MIFDALARIICPGLIYILTVDIEQTIRTVQFQHCGNGYYRHSYSHILEYIFKLVSKYVVLTPSIGIRIQIKLDCSVIFIRGHCLANPNTSVIHELGFRNGLRLRSVEK